MSLRPAYVPDWHAEVDGSPARLFGRQATLVARSEVEAIDLYRIAFPHATTIRVWRGFVRMIQEAK
jgi:hypothetical protein